MMVVPYPLHRSACLCLSARRQAPKWFSLSLLDRIIHECCREAFETEARRGFSQVRPTEAYVQSVEEAEQEKPSRARGSDDVAGIHE
jgi:hypothetical protein